MVRRRSVNIKHFLKTKAEENLEGQTGMKGASTTGSGNANLTYLLHEGWSENI